MQVRWTRWINNWYETVILKRITEDFFTDKESKYAITLAIYNNQSLVVNLNSTLT